MRISKVKVRTDDNKQKMVLMHRTIKEGSLVYEKEVKNETKNILPKKKMESFHLSMLNKTVINEKHIKIPYVEDKNQKRQIKEEYKSKYLNLKKILKARRNEDIPIRYINKEDITPFLTNKFKGEFTYRTEKDVFKFNLTTLIFNAVRNHNLYELKPYNEWKDWYIKNKSSKLSNSIEHNLIFTQEGVSKRQQALQVWEAEFLQNNKLNLDELHKTYKTDELASKLSEENPKKDDGKFIASGIYHSRLKSILQLHQRQAEIFGTRENPNLKNREDNLFVVYHNEVVKYLEHYFPIKPSNRKNSEDDINYYLNANTIKQTVKNQIENALRANLIRKGKYIQHNLTDADSVTSDNLIELKANEAFVLKLIDACAFAANNIRNIIDANQDMDILGRDNLKNSLQKNNFNLTLFNKFFPGNSNKLENINLWALRGAVQKIRNNINHYKSDALSVIFNVDKFEYPVVEGNNEMFNKTIYKPLFENDIKKLPEAFSIQLKSGGVLSQYKQEDLISLLNEMPIDLCRSVMPFAPGFKKVMKTGNNYQFAKEDDFYDLGLSTYRKSEDFNEEAWSGRYFLLKQIYSYVFLPQFMEDNRGFQSLVKFVLDRNKEFAQEKLQKGNAKNYIHRPNAQPTAYAFADVRYMRNDEEIKTYMAYLQSEWMLESSKKEENVKNEENNLNFEKFVLQVFAVGFDKFLKGKKYDFIQTPENQFPPETTPQQQADMLNKREAEIQSYCKINTALLQPDENTHISFYIFCKLLDTNHLSNFRNELIKYRVSKDDNEVFKHLLSIVELCLLNADIISIENIQTVNSQQYFKKIQPFFANDCSPAQLNEIYQQSDNKTPVLHSGIELSEKYGTLSLMEKIMQSDPHSRFTISKKNAEDWNTGKKVIEKVIKEREKLHAEWVKAKEYDDKEYKDRVREKSKFAEKFIKEKGNEYAEICEFIDTYNWLDNKLHFVHLKRLHNLTVEVLARLAGFVAVWERDLQYLEQQRPKKQNEKPISFKMGLKELIVDGEIEAYHKKTILCDDYRNIRNRVAHYSYLNSGAKDDSLIDLINQVRQLLSYDRKLKNAVAKAMIKLFEKHGMELKLSINEKHLLVAETLVPKKINHLGTSTNTRNKPHIATNHVHPQYCDMCAALLNYAVKL